jgi:hypothetical protein
MQIVLELSDKDLRHFRKCLQTVRQGEQAGDEDVVLSAASDLIAEV